MKASVEKLSIEDMLALAAYAASLRLKPMAILTNVWRSDTSPHKGKATKKLHARPAPPCQ